MSIGEDLLVSPDKTWVPLATLVSVVFAAIAGTAVLVSVRNRLDSIDRRLAKMITRMEFKLWLERAKNRTKLDLPDLEAEVGDEEKGS